VVMEFLAGLPAVSAGVLAFIFLLIVFQEAVNGFHDTANAVATVIYANAMKPGAAVALAALMNFLGVLAGGTAVAFGLVYLLPNEMIAGVNSIDKIALFLALIVTALGWNFGTWWLGMPNSTTHTYIGSIIGVGMAHAFVRGQPILEQINWHQGQKILVTLAVSPVVGFILGLVLLKMIQLFVKDPEMYRPAHHHKRHPNWDKWDQDPPSTEVAGAPSPEIAAAVGALPPGPERIERRAQQPSVAAGGPLDDASRPETRPPAAIRAGLIAGSAGVAFLHGSNDGQKSIGLMMLVLFALAPLSYGLNSNRLTEASIQEGMTALQQVESIAAQFASDPVIGKGAQRVLDETRDMLALVKTRECADPRNQQSAACAKMREGLLDLHQTISRALKQGEGAGKFSPQQVQQLTNARNVLGRFIQYVPFWVIFLSALALGLGTAFGYEKIVTTLGEKMGSAHMNPAQGTAAQASAIIGIALANFGGMPVSTTHVLSAAVLGSVAGTRGEKVNMHTVGKIAMTWATTLPGTVIVSFVLSLIFYVALV
jgi:low-affinity inorganic phosphate transporter